MKTPSIHSSIKNKTEYKNHLWYDLGSEDAKDIIAKFQSQEINPSIPPKFRIEPEDTSTPKRKRRLVIVG